MDNTKLATKLTRVLCSNYGGPECQDCPWNKARQGYEGDQFYCSCAFNGGAGGTVTLVKA